jgi:hypothetical protein
MPKNESLTSPWIYFAGPLFTAGEMMFNQKLADGLRSHGYKIYLPQEECAGAKDPKQLYDICMQGLKEASMVLIMLDGTDADSGSCFEMGYGVGIGLPIVGVRTDFRGSGEHLGVNLMLTNSCTHLILTQMSPTPAHPLNNVPNSAPTKPMVTILEVGTDPLPTLLDIFATFPAAQAAK